MDVRVHQKQPGDKRPVLAGEVLRKAAGKAMAINFHPLGRKHGKFQYGLNTLDSVNMEEYVGHSATTVDGRNAFNYTSRQKIHFKV